MYKDLKLVKRCLYGRHKFEIETSGLGPGMVNVLGSTLANAKID